MSATLAKALRIFDDALAHREFILGSRLTLGDVPMGAFLFRYFTMDIERPQFAHLNRYYTDLTHRGAYRDAVMVDYSALRGSD